MVIDEGKVMCYYIYNVSLKKAFDWQHDIEPAYKLQYLDLHTFICNIGGYFGMNFCIVQNEH